MVVADVCHPGERLTDATTGAIVADLRRGDERLFLSLIERYHRPLVRTARRHGLDGEGADRAARSAWRAFVASLDRPISDPSVGAWLYRLLREQLPLSGAEGSGQPAGAGPPSPLATLERGLRALPPDQREVVALRDIEGWSARETGLALGLSEPDQRQLLHQGRTHLCQLYAGVGVIH